MGQAKLRGSFEQRQAEGKARLSFEANERHIKIEEDKRKESLRRSELLRSSPVQYEREKQGRDRRTAALLAVAGVLSIL